MADERMWIKRSTLEGIGNAVRAKKETTDPIPVSNLESEILSIESGGNITVDAFVEGGIEEVILPTAEKIKKAAFYFDIKLKKITMPNVKYIYDSAFYGCTNLIITELPVGLRSIGLGSFGACTGLTSLTFKSTPTSIGSGAFANCTNLTTINVPWAEGAVEGAPWGATNATINYNYTGE